MKKLFLLALVFLSISAQSQVENLIPQYIFRNSLRVGGAGNNEPGTYLQIGPNSGGNKGLGLPRVANTSVVVSPTKGVTVYDLSKDSTAYYNGTTWVYSGGGGTTIISDQQKYQYSDNVNVAMSDTVTALVLNETIPNTATRVITLKNLLPKSTITIYNYNTGSYLNTLSTNIIDFDKTVTNTLENQTTYIIDSDGSYWRVKSKTKQVTGGSSPGGSSGVDLISIF